MKTNKKLLNASETEIEKYWTDLSSKRLVGKTIVEVRYLTEEEAEANGWYKRPLDIFFSDDSYIYASKDGEGNDGGVLFGSDDVTYPAI